LAIGFTPELRPKASPISLQSRQKSSVALPPLFEAIIDTIGAPE
jgi:hypothetical protein